MSLLIKQSRSARKKEVLSYNAQLINKRIRVVTSPKLSQTCPSPVIKEVVLAYCTVQYGSQESSTPDIGYEDKTPFK